MSLIYLYIYINLFIVSHQSNPLASVSLWHFILYHFNVLNTHSCNFTMNLNSRRQIPSKQILMTRLSQLHLSPLLAASATPPFLLYFLHRRLLSSCNRLNPDRHCPGVVMTTIWRSFGAANCCTDILLCGWSLCSASMSPSAASLVFSRWCCSPAMRSDRNQWLMSREILLFLFWHLIIFFCLLCLYSFFFFFGVDTFLKKAIYRQCCNYWSLAETVNVYIVQTSFAFSKQRTTKNLENDVLRVKTWSCNSDTKITAVLLRY